MKALRPADSRLPWQIKLGLIGAALTMPALALADNCQEPSPNGISFGTSLCSYVANLYNWSIGAGIGLAVIVLMYAGYLMMTSSGDPQKVGFAKEIIVGALMGLALLAGARLILNVLSVT